MSLTSFTVTYRVVTPMFLGGAEPTQEAELRLPSFKGALRFWWRALMWKEVKNLEDNLKDLRQREANLFGSSDAGQSKVLMQLNTALTSKNTMGARWERNSWEQYTGYGLRDKGERCFIPTGQEWIVKLNLRKCEPTQSAQVLAALKLLGLVGGLGSRSRKGWGSVTLVKFDGADWQCPSDALSWRRTVESLIPSNCPREAPFTAFTQNSRWANGPIQTSAASAQEWLGRRYQELVKNTMPKPDRAQFGLPRKCADGSQPQMERRASPLFLHIHDCDNRQALPVALWLPADFLADKPAIPGGGNSARRFLESLNSASTSFAR